MGGPNFIFALLDACSSIIPMSAPDLRKEESQLLHFMLFSDIPIIGPYIQLPFNKALEAQRNSLRRKPGETTVKVYIKMS